MILYVHGSTCIVHSSINIVHGSTPKMLIFNEFCSSFMLRFHHLMTITHGYINNAHYSINRAHGSTNNAHGSINRAHGSTKNAHGSINMSHGSINELMVPPTMQNFARLVI